MPKAKLAWKYDRRKLEAAIEAARASEAATRAFEAACISDDGREKALVRVSAAFYKYSQRKTLVTGPTVTEHRKRLKDIAKHAAKLCALLEDLPTNVAVHFTLKAGDIYTHQFCDTHIHVSEGKVLKTPRENPISLKRLAERALATRDVLKDVNRKDRKNKPFEELLQSLSDVWHFEFFLRSKQPRQVSEQHRAGVTKHPGQGRAVRYEGPLVEFVKALLKNEGVRFNVRGLAKRIYEMAPSVRFIRAADKGRPKS